MAKETPKTKPATIGRIVKKGNIYVFIEGLPFKPILPAPEDVRFPYPND